MKDTTVGAIATFSCKRGYRLIGEASIICHNSGHWSRVKPSCRKIAAVKCSDPGTPISGGRQLESLQVGAVVHYSCHDGYSLAGDSKRRCQGNGKWTGGLPTCNVVDCYDPGTPLNGYRQLQATTLKARVTYGCSKGYVLQGASFRICQSNGLWSGELPICIQIADCGKPSAPSNGGVNVDKTTEGATAVYYCKEGFLLSGDTQRVCQPNAKWSSYAPFCNVVDCGDPGTPTNGERDLSSTTFRSVVKYDCESGYYLVGDKVRRCLASRKWSGSLPTCKLISCGDPGTPRNGGRAFSSTTFRSAVQYNCDNGFLLVGDKIRVCTANGEWSGFIPTCRKIITDCGNPGVPIYGRSDYTGSSIGSVVFHSCTAGFVLKGDQLRHCLSTGMWSGLIPTCQRIDCGNPGGVSNGRVIYTDTTVGSRARVECKEGYRLNGQSERVCQANGRWSGTLPTCDAVNCGDPGTPKNGGRDFSSTTSNGLVLYYCSDGYTLEGDPLRRCQQNGQWSGIVPICQRQVVDCGQPELVEFGTVDTSTTTVDSVAVYICDKGYQLVGASVRVCLPSGVWSEAPPVCNIIDCGIPVTPEGGFTQVSSTTFGSEVIHTCDASFLLVGDSVRQCDITGEWSGAVPTCQPVRCGDPGTPINGIRLLTDTVLGSVVTYECGQGYALEGSDSRVCQSSGTWSGSLPACRALQCDDSGVPDNGGRLITTRAVGSEVMFTCDPGYSLVGNSIQICQTDQTWSGPLPQCVLVDCGDPGLPANAARVVLGTTFDSQVTYTCSINFMLSGEDTRICQADGMWSRTLPTCEPKELVMCADPGLPENGRRLVTSNLVTAVATFSCNEGYFLVGDGQRICQPTGRWSGDTPSCEVIDCGDPGKPSNGIVVGADFTFGASVEYECVNGFVLVGVKTRTCQNDHTWSGDQPFCKESEASQCDDPGIPDNGRRIGSDFTIGSTVYFQCFDGYELIGERSIECQPGALWSADGPFCRLLTDSCAGEGIEVFDSCRRKCTCRGGVTVDCCRLRRDWLSMNIADKLQYIDAVVRVSTDPVFKPQYDALISLYRQLSRSLAQNSDPTISQFIPWHRYFLIEYENLLRQINCGITIPYWDWTALPKNPYVSDVFDIDAGFGDSSRLNDTCVNVGAFSVNNWVLPAVIGGGCLKREYQLRNFPTRDAIDRDLLPNPASAFKTVHQTLHLVLHNLVRCTIGGTMCTPGDSAADPLYMLHLSRIDSIFSHWQDLRMGRQLVRYANDITLLTGTNSLIVADLANNQLLPYGISVCYDPPFELKNFHPARRSTEDAEMESLGVSVHEIHNLSNKL